MQAKLLILRAMQLLSGMFKCMRQRAKLFLKL